MDQHLQAWTETTDKALAGIGTDLQRQADILLMISRELANIAMMLAPQEKEGPSALEDLLAQLAAQGQESVGHLRKLVRQGDRIEAKVDGSHASPPPIFATAGSAAGVRAAGTATARPAPLSPGLRPGNGIDKPPSEDPIDRPERRL